MIRKIYTTLVSVAFAAMILTSCSDWLNVYPSDEIKEEYLFSTGDGFRTALNGIYRKLSSFNLYGSNLTWGLVDAWGQAYSLEKAPDSGGGKAMKKIADFNFKNTELVPTTDAMWNAAWNIVANCNELAQQAALADSMLFYARERERKMILGEAIGLRAFMQFDLLRIYAPAPSSVGYRQDSRTFIPYVDEYPSYVNERKTVTYCLERIVADLKEAQDILLEVDKSSPMDVSSRFKSSTTAEKLFLVMRGYRLNYYAVTAELARVYMYAGKTSEAYEEAIKLITVNKSKRYFRASTSESDIRDKGNTKMYNDVIFGLYSPTELVDWDQAINHPYDGSGDSEKFLALSEKMVERIYGTEEQKKDWRFIYQLEPKDDDCYRPLKYNKQSESVSYGKINNQTIPLIRMSEIYYIAAEAIFETNPAEALEYLKTVRTGRGLRTSVSEETKEKFVNLLVRDACREFLGEGQILYMYKRLNRRFYKWTNEQEILPLDENTVLPLPESEMNIK